MLSLVCLISIMPVMKSLFSNFFLSKKTKKQVFFYRDFIRFRGGHLKIWHYFNHLTNNSNYEPRIYLSERSLIDETNPWKDTPKLTSWKPSEADILFLGGGDWKAVIKNDAFIKKQKNLPVINFIQGLNALKPENIDNLHLKERAIRICVSEEIASVLNSVSYVNGPVFTIPNCIDYSELPEPLDLKYKDIDLLIVAIKQPILGEKLKSEYLSLSNKKIYLLSKYISRFDFLNLVNRAKATLYLPMQLEGFYLAALEGMYLHTLVICPDCMGNRSFCIDGETCFLPLYNIPAIKEATFRALALSNQQRQYFIERAKIKVVAHGIQHESKQFLSIMNRIDELW